VPNVGWTLLDVRSLPNPHHAIRKNELADNLDDIRSWLMERGPLEYEQFVEDVVRNLANGTSVRVQCVGGRHRSQCVAYQAHARAVAQGINVSEVELIGVVATMSGRAAPENSSVGENSGVSKNSSVSKNSGVSKNSRVAGASGEGGQLIERIGDLLQCTEQYIVHQTNCVTTKAAGLAKFLFQAFPHADCYKDRSGADPPGEIRIDGGGANRLVIGLHGQYNPGKPKGAGQCDVYDCVADREKWFAQGLALIGQVSGIHSVAFPDHIGCGMAGGDWRRYRAMLSRFATQNPHIEVVLYQLESEHAKTTAVKSIGNGNGQVPKADSKPKRGRNRKVNRVQR